MHFAVFFLWKEGSRGFDFTKNSQEQPPIAGSVDRRMHTFDRRMDLKNLIGGRLNMLIGVYIFVSR